MPTFDKHYNEITRFDAMVGATMNPRAYKNVEDVMAAQADLVEIVHELHGVVCVKG